MRGRHEDRQTTDRQTVRQIVRQIERQTDGQKGCIEERGEEVRKRKNDVGSDSCLNSPPPVTSHHITSYQSFKQFDGNE